MTEPGASRGRTVTTRPLTRADIEGVERVRGGMTAPLGFRNFLPVLRALLDEHEMTLEFGGEDLDGSGAWQKAEEAIQQYGESE